MEFEVSFPGGVAVAAHLPLRDARELWLGACEREYLTRVLALAGGDVAAAAARARVHVKSFQRLLRQHGLKG